MTSKRYLVKLDYSKLRGKRLDKYHDLIKQKAARRDIIKHKNKIMLVTTDLFDSLQYDLEASFAKQIRLALITQSSKAGSKLKVKIDSILMFDHDYYEMLRLIRF